jgi:hypothetical protein
MNDLDTLGKLLDDKTIVQYSPNCLRQKSNFSKSGGKYRFDNIRFKPNRLLRDIPTHSPKLAALLRKIHELDAQDQLKYGKTFKHFIFSDLKSGAYGAKLIASALVAKGMTLGYRAPRLNPDDANSESSPDSDTEDEEEESDGEEGSPKRPAGRKEFGPVELLDDATLLNTRGDNFYLLASTSVYEKPISVRMKKAILAKFNERPANVNGDLARIIVMDSGFKEGIDLFDIKYIHIFEPSVNAADQKQVIGRGTRTCGQKGLDFHPRYGWPLHVFVYDLAIPEEYRGAFLGAKTTFELYMKALNVDVRLLNFGYDIERLTVFGSVDYDLNKNIHHFSIEQEGQEGEIREHAEGADEEVFGGIKGGGPFDSVKNIFRFGKSSKVGIISNEAETIETIDSLYKRLKNKRDELNTTGLNTQDYDNINKQIQIIEEKIEEKIKDLQESTGGTKRKTKKNQKKLSPGTVQKIQDATQNIQFVDLRKKPEGYNRRKEDIFIYDRAARQNSREPEQNGHIDDLPSVPSAPSLPSSRNTPEKVVKNRTKTQPQSPIENILRRYPGIPPLPKIGRVIMGHDAMRQYIDTEFRQFTWDEVKMENQCITKETKETKGGSNSDKKQEGGKRPELIDYTPTQDFIRHYFTPTAPVKGMLLWHSVGTGKTCSAIAAASSSFEAQGYTILWVTRTTLKNDIWKNMFSQVCNENIRKKIKEIDKAGGTFPEEQEKQMRMLSHAWRIRPISYKQFSNLVSKQNDYYKRLVKENGEEDPLRKTLLIIDEAHKLYGGGDLSSLERPDMVALHDSLMRSYAISGADSVRLLLMTATPITESPIEIVQLVNLCKPLEEQMPSSFEEFSDNYLDERGEFTAQGREQYLDEIAGHISYLNREKDARQFAQPIIHHVNVPIVSHTQKKTVADYDAIAMRESSTRSIAEKKEELERTSKKLEGDLKGLNASKFSNLLGRCNNPEEKKMCEKIVKRNIKDLTTEAKAYLKTIQNQIEKVRGEYKRLTTTKSEHLNRIRSRVEKNPTAFEKYKESAYYTLRAVCSTKIRTNEDFEEHIKEDAEIARFNSEIRDYEIRIQEMENSLKTMVDAYRLRIAHMRKLLSNSDLLERDILRATIREEERMFSTTKREQTRKNREAIENLKEEIKEAEHGKKERVTDLRKTVRQRYQIEKKERKNIKTARNKINTELRAKGKLKFSDNTIQNLVEVYEKKIGEELVEAQGQQEKAMADKAAMNKIKQDKAIAKEKATQDKAIAKEKATQDKAIAKEKAAQDKAIAKEKAAQDKAVKQAKREQDKATKAKIREETRQTKKREQEAKKAQTKKAKV